MKVITAVFFVLSVFTPSDKLFFILCSFFVFFIWLTTKSIFITFFLSYIPLSVFLIGQEYTFLAVPKSIISSFQYPEGRTLSYIFSPFTVLLLSIIGTTFFAFFSRKIKKIHSYFFCLLLVVLLVITSASKSLYFSVYSMIYALHWLAFASFAFIISNNNQLLDKNTRTRLWESFFFQVAFTLLFISALASFQLVRRAPLGLNIESVKSAPFFGAGADESNLIFRPVGLTPHANMMGNEVFILMMTLIAVYIRIKNQKKLHKYVEYFFAIVILAALFTLIIAQSRSVYLALAFFSALMLFFNYSEFKKLVEMMKVVFLHQKKIWFFVFLFIAVVIFNRAWYSKYSFTETGGFEIRHEMNQEAVSLIVKYPVLGVGSGMFIPALAAENPTGIVKKFPESVHNGFLLFVAENGLLTQLFLLIFFFFLVRKIYFSRLSYNIKTILVIGLLSQLVPMFFQPFINYLTVYTIATLTLLSEE